MILVVLVVAAGCTHVGTAITTPYATSPPHLEHGPVYEVKVGEIAGLGTVLVDGQGLTLYLYSTDRQGSPSRCYGVCAIAWPPLVLPSGVSRPIAGPGIRTALLGSAPRTDGTTADHLQRVAALPLAARPHPGKGHRPGADQRRRALVRPRPCRQRHPHGVGGMSEPALLGRSASGSPSGGSSRWSIGSVGSILSVGSVGSMLSVGSVGSILSVGSVASFLSLGSMGSALSAASVGSLLSLGSLLSFRSVGSVLSARSRRGVRARRLAPVKANGPAAAPDTAAQSA